MAAQHPIDTGMALAAFSPADESTRKILSVYRAICPWPGKSSVLQFHARYERTLGPPGCGVFHRGGVEAITGPWGLRRGRPRRRVLRLAPRARTPGWCGRLRPTPRVHGDAGLYRGLARWASRTRCSQWDTHDGKKRPPVSPWSPPAWAVLPGYQNGLRWSAPRAAACAAAALATPGGAPSASTGPWAHPGALTIETVVDVTDLMPGPAILAVFDIDPLVRSGASEQ